MDIDAYPDDVQVDVIIYRVPVIRFFINKECMVQYGGEDRLAEYLRPMIQRVVNHVLIERRSEIATLTINNVTFVKGVATTKSDVKQRLDIHYSAIVGYWGQLVYFTEYEFNKIRELLLNDVANIASEVKTELMK